MASEGYIMYETIQAMEGKNSTLKTPVKLNQHSGKQSHFALAFSNQNWGSSTRLLTKRVKEHPASEITAIVKKAQETVLTFVGSKRDAGSSASGPSTMGIDDPYRNICKSAHSQMMFLTSFFLFLRISLLRRLHCLMLGLPCSPSYQSASSLLHFETAILFLTNSVLIPTPLQP